MSMTQNELRLFDELRHLIAALDRHLSRVQEQVTTLAHEVNELKRKLPPLDLRGKQ
jgi:hypothetical protein